MKIALVCPASLPATQFGGIMFLCIDIAKELARIGHDVTIYTTDLDFANNANTFNKNLPRIELHDGFTINRSHVWFSYKLFYVNAGMYSQMMKDDFDIIHTIGIRGFQSLIATMISKKKKIPLVISDQGGLTTHPDLQRGIARKFLYKLQKPMLNFIINQATKIIVANEYEKEIFSNFTMNSKIEVIRNGVDLEELKIEKRYFKEKNNIKNNFILFLGRFSKVKGIDILLNAINLIKDTEAMQNTKMVIMGVDFGFEKEMLQMISELEITHEVMVIKNPPRQDVIAAYNECDFLVLPSRWELSPLTPLEGFAFKKTVVSTKAHGIPHTIKDRENCILVAPENNKELANAILELLSDSKKCVKYGLAGYKLVQDICNSKIMAENIFKIYQDIVNR
ncbi:MAG: glycosyltransferase family 4 protein [Nitrosopumilaceae archaeon]